MAAPPKANCARRAQRHDLRAHGDRFIAYCAPLRTVRHDAGPNFTRVEIRDQRRKASAVILMRVGERHDVYRAEAAIPQVGRHDVLADIELRAAQSARRRGRRRHRAACVCHRETAPAGYRPVPRRWRSIRVRRDERRARTGATTAARATAPRSQRPPTGAPDGRGDQRRGEARRRATQAASESASSVPGWRGTRPLFARATSRGPQSGRSSATR